MKHNQLKPSVMQSQSNELLQKPSDAKSPNPQADDNYKNTISVNSPGPEDENEEVPETPDRSPKP